MTEERHNSNRMTMMDMMLRRIRVAGHERVMFSQREIDQEQAPCTMIDMIWPLAVASQKWETSREGVRMRARETSV